MLTFDTIGQEVEKPFTYEHISTMESEPTPANDATVVISPTTTDPDHDSDYESSVEQALRELDIAIGDNSMADDSDGEENESESGEPVETSGDDEEHLENVLRQLFIDNMLSSLGANTEQEDITSPQEMDNDDHSNIELEEEVGTGEIRNDGEMQLELPQNSQVAKSDLVMDGKEEQRVIPSDSNNQKEEVISEDNFFDDLPDICQSTPSIRNKRSTVDVISRPHPALQFNDDLLEDVSFPSPVNEADGESEGTFVVAKSSKVMVIPTVQVVCQDQEEAVADQTFEVGHGINAEPQQQNTNINKKYLRDTNTTLTPLNTPSEVNYEEYEEGAGSTNVGGNVGGEGDMTFTKDLDEATSSNRNSGWFLHPQEVPQPAAASDETFDYESFPPPPPLDEYYYGDEAELGDGEGFGLDDDNDGEYERGRASMDFDALRKQLADLLPHAQGAPALDDEGAVGG